jgi:hypothetical protein
MSSLSSDYVETLDGDHLSYFRVLLVAIRIVGSTDKTTITITSESDKNNCHIDKVLKHGLLTWSFAVQWSVGLSFEDTLTFSGHRQMAALHSVQLNIHVIYVNNMLNKCRIRRSADVRRIIYNIRPIRVGGVIFNTRIDRGFVSGINITVPDMFG